MAGRVSQQQQEQHRDLGWAQHGKRNHTADKKRFRTACGIFLAFPAVQDRAAICGLAGCQQKLERRENQPMNKERKQFMKTCKPVFFTALTLFAALAITVQTSAQNQTSTFDATAKGKIKTFDVKGAGKGSGQGTFPFMNNDKGAITGWYCDAAGYCHGFLRAPHGHITSFDVPGAGSETVPESINPLGEIAGFYQDPNYLYHGFLLAADGETFTIIDSPGAGTGTNQGTLVRAINPAGTIAGHYIDANNAFHGFVRAPDGYITTFDDPKAGTGTGQGTKVAGGTGINRRGVIAGRYIDGKNVNHGYLRHLDGSFTTIDGPGAVFSDCSDIAPNGTIVGYFQDTNNVYHGFSSTPPYKKITQLDDPNAGTGANQGTFGYDINPAGTIMGYYIDTRGKNHGFQLAPDGTTYTTIDVPGATGTFPQTNNNKGAITGWYLDKNNASHGFLWTP